MDDEREDEPLAAAPVEDITAGIITTGVGGTPVGEEPDVGADTEGQGLDQIVEQAERAGWGRPSNERDQRDDTRRP